MCSSTALEMGIARSMPMISKQSVSLVKKLMNCAAASFTSEVSAMDQNMEGFRYTGGTVPSSVVGMYARYSSQPEPS